MTESSPLLLKVLLEERRWHAYGTFQREYNKAAAKIDADLYGTCPSRAQLHRWTSGELKRLPYADHCRVLEQMFPGWTAEQLFSPHDAKVGAAVSATSAAGGRAALNIPPAVTDSSSPQYADVSAVYPTRAEFAASLPPQALFDGATTIRACGLSLNLLTQQYPDQQLAQMIRKGGSLQALFLDPNGEAIKAREREEHHNDGTLVGLTQINIGCMTRLRDSLPPEAQDRLRVAVYDETIRFNITIVDDETCVVQPYLPQARGVDSPTLVINKPDPWDSGLFSMFTQVFASLWERSTSL